eukprot:4829236-Pyramimonas_sp.AAC.1
MFQTVALALAPRKLVLPVCSSSTDEGWPNITCGFRSSAAHVRHAGFCSKIRAWRGGVEGGVLARAPRTF